MTTNLTKRINESICAVGIPVLRRHRAQVTKRPWKRALSSASLCASLTIEAALSLTLFMFTVILLSVPMEILDTQRKVQTVLEVTGRELGWQVYRTSHTVHPAEMEAGKAAEAEEYPNAADYIYLGIVHDTNAFQRADESIMKAATKLLELGVDHRRIIQTRQIDTLEDLEKIWDEYQVYNNDEINLADGKEIEIRNPDELED